MIKCALHVHTNLSDGAMDPEEAIRIYQDLDFQVVAVTDHEFMCRDFYPARVRALSRPGLMALAGVEIDYEPWHYQHLVRIQGESETLHVLAHPANYYLETGEVLARLGSTPFPIDAIEITQRGSYAPAYDLPSIGVPKIATDDAHEPGDCGRAWIELERATSPDQVIRAIKAGDFAVRFAGGRR
jgi:hypothetical protein